VRAGLGISTTNSHIERWKAEVNNKSAKQTARVTYRNEWQVNENQPNKQHESRREMDGGSTATSATKQLTNV
jgi:hypothetical protein